MLSLPKPGEQERAEGKPGLLLPLNSQVRDTEDGCVPAQVASRGLN